MKVGWEMKALKEVCKIKPPKKEARDRLGENDEVTFLPMNMLGIDQKYCEGTERKKLKEVAGSYTYFRENDVLLAKITPCFENGKLGIANNLENGIGFGSSEFIVYRPSDEINREYLYYFLYQPSFRETGSKRMTGAVGHKRIPKDFYEDYLIPIPPIHEQKQIVQILDGAFAAIDKAKANIEKNIENAKELYQSKLNEIFSQKGEGWEEKSLNDVCKVERGSSPRPIKKFLTTKEEGVHWVKIGDVGESDKYVTRTAQFITKAGAKKSRFVDVGDLILSNSMSFGRPYLMKISGYIHDGWFVLRVPEELNGDYFWEVLASPFLKRQFNELAAGAIVKNISGDLVKKAKIPLPSFSEQQKIVREIGFLRDSFQQLNDNYDSKLKALEELKKAILHKAFTGELKQKDLML
jgi:type I restriction enzyme S subunit